MLSGYVLAENAGVLKANPRIDGSSALRPRFRRILNTLTAAQDRYGLTLPGDRTVNGRLPASWHRMRTPSRQKVWITPIRCLTERTPKAPSEQEERCVSDNGGGSGIRTHGAHHPTVFKTVAFVRSAIPPSWSFAFRLDHDPIIYPIISDSVWAWQGYGSGALVFGRCRSPQVGTRGPATTAR